jgi:L-ascorbate metabolism protein UlaG (beta-lactamase superfamily)
MWHRSRGLTMSFREPGTHPVAEPALAEPLSRREMNRRLAALLTSAVVPAAGCASKAWDTLLPSPARFQVATPPGTVTARFFGNSSILFQDGRKKILSDGFVSRPRGWRVAIWRIAPDHARIDAALKCLEAPAIDAVFVAHSHYDHALDAPTIACKTGAELLGSESTANLGRAAKLPADRIRVVQDGETRCYGDFELTFIESAHHDDFLAPGVVSRPFSPPAHSRRWKTGTVWSVLVRHGGRSLLVHSTTGYKFGALRNRRADVVYLGIGTLTLPRRRFIDAYWDEVVGRTGARRVILVHWDDFTKSLDVSLRPRSHFGFERIVSMICERAVIDGVEVVLPVLWQPTDPFAGLPQATRPAPP